MPGTRRAAQLAAGQDRLLLLRLLVLLGMRVSCGTAQTAARRSLWL